MPLGKWAKERKPQGKRASPFFWDSPSQTCLCYYGRGMHQGSVPGDTREATCPSLLTSALCSRGTTLRPQLSLALDQLWVLSLGRRQRCRHSKSSSRRAVMRVPRPSSSSGPVAPALPLLGELWCHMQGRRACQPWKQEALGSLASGLCAEQEQREACVAWPALACQKTRAKADALAADRESVLGQCLCPVCYESHHVYDLDV